MNVLIGCEESQTVCKAFRAHGAQAFSCDLKPCSGGQPQWHLQMDIFEAIWLKRWDFIGLHPTCTYMAFSGNRHYSKGKEKHYLRLLAREWTMKLWEHATHVCDHVYLENPMGALNGDQRLPSPQIIHPYYFGDEFQKQTCLWLHGLPKLIHVREDNLFEKKSHVGKGEFFEYAGGTKRQPMWIANAKGFGKKKTEGDVQTIRSKTFPGIAKAMAEQWGPLLTN